MDIFYKPDIDSDLIILDAQESAHCIRVMRYKSGDSVCIIDGRGGYFIAEIVREDPKACTIKIVSRQENYKPLPYELHLAIAPTKNTDRFEWFLEKATEIGITSITPIICRRSERRNIRMDRMEKIVIAAMKQSVKAYLPRLNTLVSFEEWVKGQESDTRYIAHCMDGPKRNIWNADLSVNNAVLIGPEGDFTAEEVVFAEKHGFMPISLGTQRLRTETAGIVACTAVYMGLNK